jgi:rod shape-determining protein MreB
VTVSAKPAALAVDLGSRTACVWTADHGTVTGPCGEVSAAAGTPVRRGRIVDVDGCVGMLSELVRRYPQPVVAGGVVVACRPVLAAEADEEVFRHVLDSVFAPSRLLFLDTVCAAAIGSGAAAGSLLLVDVGAELTEVALLDHGRIIAAHRAEVGTRDVPRAGPVEPISDNVVGSVDELRAGPHTADLLRAMARGTLLVGDGALHPTLASVVSRTLRVRVHRAAAPHTAAVEGAGRAAMSLLRHPAVAWPVARSRRLTPSEAS